MQQQESQTGERKRFFRDDLESSENNIPFVAPILNNKDSSLFGDHAQSEKEEVRSSRISQQLASFGEQLKELIPDLSDAICSKLFEKFGNGDSAISSAVDYYFEHSKSLLMGSDDIPDIIDLSQDPKGNDDRSSSHYSSSHNLNSDPPQVIEENSSPSMMSLMTQSIQLKRKRTNRQEEVSKKIKHEPTWKRFIGSLPATAMITRPTIRPLEYGSQLIMHASNTENSKSSKIYNSNGKRKVSMAHLVRILDQKSGREIGRMPEELARLIHPLIDASGVIFNLTLIYGGDRRLSVGDNFIVQLDCYLTSDIFGEYDSSSDTVDHNKKKSKWEPSSQSMVETDNELSDRFKRMGLITLFKKLRIREITDESSHLKSLEKDINEEIIDLEDDDAYDSIMSEQNDIGTEIDENETMNLNQLQNFYNVAQSTEALKNLPETTPSTDIMKLELRKYQKQGLTWMFRREGEFMKAAHSTDEETPDTTMMNPLWKQFAWPKDMSWSKQDVSDSADPSTKSLFFYGNLHTGEFSLEKPVLTTSMKGGILSDEMGLGKTISTLSLILSSPHDESLNEKQLFEQDEVSTQNPEIPYAAKTTLIVVPMSLLNQWESEFKKACNNDEMHSEIYYGGNVSNLKTFLTKTKTPPTVLITTYGIIQNEWTKFQKEGHDAKLHGGRGLFSIKFYRIVLDEGHIIRNRNTVTSKAVMQLSGSRRWVLTGTPIINRLDDMYSLVKFLRLEPWSQIGFWKQFVSVPFENKLFKQAFDVVNSIMEPVFLRRTKQMKDSNGEPLVNLPPKQIVVERLKLNEKQESLYKTLLQQAETSVRQGLAQGDLLKKYSIILVNILRLRQVCCDVRLIGAQDEMDEDLSKSNTMVDNASSVGKLIDDAEDVDDSTGFQEEEFNKAVLSLKEKHDLTDPKLSLECSICTTEPIDLNDIVFTECLHPFCRTCLTEYCDYQDMRNLDLKCPLCRNDISRKRLLTLSKNNDGTFDVVQYGRIQRNAKVASLIKHLQQLQDSSPGEQVVVFSQFSTYLDILENDLKEAIPSDQVEIYKFDGRLNLKERSTVLERFQQKDPSKQKILLLSLKAGGVGLNLTCASYAFMMDPWWSPSMEDQAVDRIHRIGQTSNVQVTRFIIEDSIEEKMLRIQERKRTIGEAMDADEDERRKRRIDEIKMLFE